MTVPAVHRPAAPNNHLQPISVRWKSLTCCQKTAYVAKKIFLGVMYIAWMLFQAALFFVGVIFGILFTALMQKMIDKIKELWKKQPWAVVGMTTLVTILAFPVTLMATAFVLGCHLGITFSKGILEKKGCCGKKRSIPPPQPRLPARSRG
jgi:hypothetical protein